jgi:hypothetical protein
MRIIRLLAAALVVTLLAVLTSGPAQAHNSLTGATPAKNATLDRAPGGVELTFLQRVDPAALTITVTGAGAAPVAAGPPRAKGRTGAIEFSETLPNGVYTVRYRVGSRDGHPVQGSYRFTVDDPAAEPAPVVSATPAAPSAPAAEPAPVPVVAAADDSVAWPVPAAIVGLAVLLGAGVMVLVRRRRTT